jgi:hypothetical protein
MVALVMKKFDIKWIALTIFIIAGTSVALKMPWLKWSFPGFVIAHGILVYDFARTHKNLPLLLQNSYFFIVNIIATYIWFFK